MNPIRFALRHPMTVMVMVVSIIIGSVLAIYRMKIDIFPSLNLPVIYVAQPYGGMNPKQMEGLLTNYYEFHFLYVSGIHHIESKNTQAMSLLKLYFHPGTDMSSAMGEVVAAVNRSRFMMPPGTVPPFVARVDTGNASVGYLVLSSETKQIKDIQDLATLKVRPLFAGIPGISTPPAFGGNQRAIVVQLDPERLRSYHLTPDDVTNVLAANNSVTPSGNVRIGDLMYMVQTNAMMGPNPTEELKKVPITTGANPRYLEEVATIIDSSDIAAGYVLVNGRRSVYMMVTKRADASTLDVVANLREALPRLREQVPDDVQIDFAFDQSPIVTESMIGVGLEGGLGAILTGLMVLIFLRDWRSVIVVVLNIPLAILSALIGLWLCGQTLNLMTLGGLALAVGILVDEATVEVENIHTQMHKTPSVPRAVRLGNSETAVPRFLAMLCILAVFLPSAFMEGAARALFVPLSLSVGFAMVASYLLSSTFVPVLSVWLLKHTGHGDHRETFLQRIYGGLSRFLVRLRHLVVLIYFGVAALLLYFLSTQIGTEIFPETDRGQFQLRLRAPTGTRIERTEEIMAEATNFINQKVGKQNVGLTVGYVGMVPTNYPVQLLYQWTGGPEEAFIKFALKPDSGIRINQLKIELREELPKHLAKWLERLWTDEGLSAQEIKERLAAMRYSFEPADIISEVMSFGSPTPVEVSVTGPNIEESLAYSRRLKENLAQIPALRDLQFVQAQDYPTIEVNIDRPRAARSGMTSEAVANSLIPATASSRYMKPLYWRDPKSGQGYLIQVQVPIRTMNSIREIELLPVKSHHSMYHPNGEAMANGMNGGTPMMATSNGILLRDVADVTETKIPGQMDRYNMRRYVSLIANVEGEDLGRIEKQIRAAIAKTGEKPRGSSVDIRGQLEPMNLIFRGLAFGLALAVVVIFLLLTAYFQSIRLALVAVSSVPAALVGVGVILWLTGTTLNLQSFMGAIMSLGVAVANAILLVTFAEKIRRETGDARLGAVEGGKSRLRPIIMTSCAMIAGMIPMAIGFGEGGDQTRPLGLAVIGGLSMATLATLLLLPSLFTILQRRTSVRSASLDPDDPGSRYYDGKDRESRIGNRESGKDEPIDRFAH
jgi:multidrug efflux pump subunit AcrB